ncbi:alpha/beta fold hydrolase [Pontibacter actiniarum]|uniref:Alpha/beta hydrolase n=1 Tax=Pontibacter actiniarum TaxID=323450 RepID=A0A1X9YVL7_9BACT|nr:alpha/beta hydrolase [Pontibacter actiniarum]ARS36966.1 alpha/beta hydrolase [Pontibacter actiniarum]
MQNLLLLHGALGSAAMLKPLQEALQNNFSVYTLDFSGHGGKPLPQEPFRMELFVQDILHFLEQQQLSSTHVFGYSMGGYAALSLALQHPERIRSVYTLATKFAWSAEAAEKETKLLNPDKVAEKVPQFAAALAQRHAPQDWRQVMQHTAAMMRQLGQHPTLTPESLPQLQVPVQVAVGDRDTMVTVEETLWAYRLLPNAQLQVLPNTRHPFETLSIQNLTQHIRQFIGQVSVEPTEIP